MRTSILKTIPNSQEFKNQLLGWSQQFREVILLDSNEYKQTYSSFDMVLAVDAFTSIKTDFTNAFEDLYQYQSQTKDWLFGYLSYDLKNDIEKLSSKNQDNLEFSDMYFFQPKKLFLIKDNQVEIQYLMLCDDEVEADFIDILMFNVKPSNFQISAKDTELIGMSNFIQQKVSKSNYLSKVSKMLEHIHRGDIYEANFCIEFYAENAKINPLEVFNNLNSISKPPFATFFKNNEQYLLSASPERYLKKMGNKVISQPIKGTSKRFLDANLDENSKNELQKNSKERSENIMIVDLVRNDLSKTAIKNSVKVEELCQVYTFNQVHQMISTIASEVSHTTSPIEILKTTFPMGSMTGAPKISAMNIIDELEETKRGLYSGSVGYFAPNGDFDFNVVIRSILYSVKNQYVSFSVGSAITSKSNPEAEYEECLLKAKAMHQVLQSN